MTANMSPFSTPLLPRALTRINLESKDFGIAAWRARHSWWFSVSCWSCYASK